MLFLILILAIGIFLRIYKIETNYYFTGELGKELLFMHRFASDNSLPSVGMTTSHEWLSYGPIYYWIMIPLFNIFSGNPFILFWSAFAVSIFGLILSYIYFKKIAGEKVALAAMAVMAVSPFFIFQTRLSKLHVFFFLIIPIFSYLLYLLWNGKKKWVVPTGILFGILFSFHFSQIPLLILPILLFLIKRNIYKFSSFMYFGLGVIIPNITLIWQDRNLILWLPYRVANIANKNPLGTFRLLTEYFGKNIFWDNRLWIVGLIIFILLFVHYFLQNKSKFTEKFLPFYLISSISVMIFANILHGAPPVHYFLPMMVPQAVLYGVYLAKIKLWWLLLAFIMVINFMAFKNDPVFYKSFSGLVPGTDMVSYSTQDVLTSFILADSKGKPFSVKRVGAFDYFPENYSQNYKYLLVWKGGDLVEDLVNTYTITEDMEKGDVSVKK